MPNGFHGTKGEWKRLETPLLEITPSLEAFAGRHEMAATRNHHAWPERSLRWGTDPARLIQIYLEDEERLTWNLWLCASQDRGGRRFWKQAYLRRGVPMAELSPAIDGLLDEALRLVSSWRLEDLELASGA